MDTMHFDTEMFHGAVGIAENARREMTYKHNAKSPKALRGLAARARDWHAYAIAEVFGLEPGGLGAARMPVIHTIDLRSALSERAERTFCACGCYKVGPYTNKCFKCQPDQADYPL